MPRPAPNAMQACAASYVGLFFAVPGARAFRRHLSTYAVKPDAGIGVLRDALALVVDSPSELTHTEAA